ncbi:MAG: hypothetical protein PHC28_15145 [Flavobacterium sp.]|uniref:hypothetical protein n=1 Tax=Flavobacterium sp. TaxID=239 RepID=UPI00260A6FA0|nr:hypothetical protein [Flavobacterium sp.]MDD5151790.1 hypothetical protein [Flavobacterium sp.]
MNINDVYYWKYKNDVGDQRSIYWCKSKIAIVNSDGILEDTFWSSGDTVYNLNNRLEEIDLTFIANLSDLEVISEDKIKLYHKKDIVDLRHSNNSDRNLIFKRIGSKPSIELYLGSLSERLGDIEYEIKSLQDEANRIKHEFSDIDIITYNRFLMSKSYYLSDPENYDLVWFEDRFYSIHKTEKYIYGQSSLSEETIQGILNHGRLFKQS